MPRGFLNLVLFWGLTTGLAAQDFPNSVFLVSLGDAKSSVVAALAPQGPKVVSPVEVAVASIPMNGFRVGVRFVFAGSDDASPLGAVVVRKVGWGDRLAYLESTLLKLQEKYGLPTQTSVGEMQTFTWSLANGNRIELVEDSGTAEATLTYKTPAYDAWVMAQQKPLDTTASPAVPANPF